MGGSIFEKKIPDKWLYDTSQYKGIRDSSGLLFQRFSETLICLIEKEFGITRFHMGGTSINKDVVTCRKVFVYVTLSYFPDIESKKIGAFIDKGYDCINNIVNELYPENVSKKQPDDFMAKVSRIRFLLKNVSVAELVTKKT